MQGNQGWLGRMPQRLVEYERFELGDRQLPRVRELLDQTTQFGRLASDLAEMFLQQVEVTVLPGRASQDRTRDGVQPVLECPGIGNGDAERQIQQVHLNALFRNQRKNDDASMLPRRRKPIRFI